MFLFPFQTRKRLAGVKVPILLTCLASVTPWGIVDGFACRKALGSLQGLQGSPYSTTGSCSCSSRLHAFNYGRGADIWPECNEDPVQLQDSFPNGQIPYSAIMAMDLQDMSAVHTSYQESVNETPSVESEIIEKAKGGKHEHGRKRRAARFLMSKTVRRLLRRAAAREELDSEQAASDATPGVWDKLPVIIAIVLLLKGLVRPLDVGWVSSLTAYYVILNMVARSPRENGLAPIMPATPPQGHVPTMVSNPLGIETLYSATYDLWLKAGVVLGLVAPIVQVASYMIRHDQNVVAARLCARPIFLLCWQTVSELYSRRVMAPLPIRILIPVTYNTARLAYLYQWAFAMSTTLGRTGRLLAMANLVYWSLNLFAFLIPIAVVRYMRAHFYGVEASEVTTRIGMEATVGLVPNIQ